MSAAPTPGELAYVAYVRVRYGMPEADAALTYAGSIPEDRAAWEAAAQAVLTDARVRADAVAALQIVVQATQARLAREEER